MFLRITVAFYLLKITIFPSQGTPLSGISSQNSTASTHSIDAQSEEELHDTERERANAKDVDGYVGMFGNYWQGDIVNPPVEIMGRGVVNRSRAGIWPGTTILYTFAHDVSKSHQKMIKSAFDHISSSTCLKFENTKRVFDKLFITSKTDTECFSRLIGYSKGDNHVVNLGSVCKIGEAIHEILHAIGLLHTFVRPDRDRYIKLNMNNILESFRPVYRISSERDYQTFGAYFDLDSIMMFPAISQFSNRFMRQYDVVPPTSPFFLVDIDSIGKKNRMSPMDKYLVQRLFNCCRIPWNYNSTAKYVGKGGRAKRRKRFSKRFREKRLAGNNSVNAKTKSGKIHAHLPMLVAMSICQQNLDFQSTKIIQVPLDRYYNEVPDHLNEYFKTRVVWNKTCTHPTDCARFRLKTVELSRDFTMSRQSFLDADPGEFGKWFQGDLIDDPHNKNTRTGVDDVRRWPHGVIYIIFDHGVTFSEEETIKDVLAEIQLKSCILVTYTKPLSFDQGVVITTNQPGCYSQSVGMSRVKKLHRMNLNAKGCLPFRGKIMHQLLHILGLHHEHVKPGGAYTEVLEKNIRPERRDNFRAVATESKRTWGFPVDFGSVMMYPSNAFANALFVQTIVPRDLRYKAEDLKKMGQREGMSQQDLAKLNLLYDCCGRN